MTRIRLLLAAPLLAVLLAGCGKSDTGKNDQLMPPKQDERTKPEHEPKKDADHKHKSSHEPG